MKIKRAKHNAEKVLDAIIIFIFVWIVASILNTVCHNMSDYNYASWNIFYIFCKIRTTSY